jgi:hypothetical protein
LDPVALGKIRNRCGNFVLRGGATTFTHAIPRNVCHCCRLVLPLIESSAVAKYGDGMRYRIRYFRKDKLLGERVWDGLLRQVQKIAQDGLIAHDADIVRILDETGQEAAMVKRHAKSI